MLILKSVFPTAIQVIRADAGAWAAATLLIAAVLTFVAGGPLILVALVGILEYMSFVFLRQFFAGERMFRLKKMGAGLRLRSIMIFLILPALWYGTVFLSAAAVIYLITHEEVQSSLQAGSDLKLPVIIGSTVIWLVFELVLLIWCARIMCAAAAGTALRPAFMVRPFIRSLPATLTCIILTMIVVGMISFYLSQLAQDWQFNPDSDVPYLLRQFLSRLPGAAALVILTASTLAVGGLAWKRSQPGEDQSLVRVFE